MSLKNRKCFCGKPATVLIDSDSWQYRDGMPVCDEHDTGDRPETPINFPPQR